jgi:glycerophosphoryl diester phosphodiesterase
VLAAAVVTLVSACGGGSDGSSADRTSSSTAPRPTSASADDRQALVIAHRGASAYAPEHTFAAYDLALEQGADFIEQDLQLSADGELVVMHDDTLDRTARGPAESCSGTVRDKTLEQLRACDVGSWFNEDHPELADPAFVDLRIPTMREVIERYGRDVRYYIETKSPDEQPGMERALLDLLDETKLSGKRAVSARQVILQSFSAESLQRILEERPDLPLVLLLSVSGSPITESSLDAAAAFAIGIGPSSGNADAALVAAAHERCLDVHPYTVDDPATMSALLDAGVDGMFTNAPDVLLAQRGTRTSTAPSCPQS